MPFALAIVASALIHAAALLGGGWDLPGVHEPEAVVTIDAVLAKPPAAAVAKPAARPPAEKPRPRVLAAGPKPDAPTTPSAGAPSVAPAEPPPATVPTAITGPQSGIPGTQSAPAPTLEPAPPTPVLIALPGKGRVRYSITRGEGGFVIGQSVHTWQHDGLTYKVQSVTETTGLAAVFKPARVVQSSAGEVTAEGLRPREFRHERVGGLDTASFDWERRVVAYAGREDSLAVGTQDFLSMYYQLVLLAPKAGALDVTIATGRKLETYRFDVLGEESVALPSGERRALRVKTGSGNDSIEVWLAVGDGSATRGLPLKIRFTDRKGEIFDQLADESALGETQ